MTDPRLTDAAYRLAIFSAVENPETLSEVFESVLGTHPTDAKIWTRYLPGVVNETFSLTTAEQLATEMARLGLQVRILREDEVPDLHRAARAHHLRCGASGLELIDVEGQSEFLIRWPAIEMICVGEVPLDTSRHFAGELWDGIAGGRRSPHLPVETTRSTGLEAWITCRSPYPNLRIDHTQMNYEYLGERRLGSATSNFRSLIGDLAERSTEATLTESTVAYLQHSLPVRYRFQSASDLLRYATIHAIRARECAGDESNASLHTDDHFETPAASI